MNKIKNFIILFILLFFYIIIVTINYVQATTSNITDEVFRLHVIANSDSETDQNLKYKVRDGILNFLKNNSENIHSKSDTINFINNNKEEILLIAKNIIKENGFNYNVNLNIGNFSFPTKQYGDISLPSGYYDALRVEIGNANGQNWWCVMFPPLCFIDVTNGIVPDESKEILEENLDTEEYAIVSEDSGLMKIKFKIIEMFENINITLGRSNN